MSEEFADEPVVFIAVNSGNSKQAIQKYFSTTKVPWPVIVDSSRQFEEMCGLQSEVSLNNIAQVRYVTVDGRLNGGNFRDMPGVAKKALENAKWKTDPQDVPKSLRQAWKSIEFGNYQGASRDVAKGLDSQDEVVQSMAKEFESLAMKEFKRQVNPALAFARDGEFWQAYKAMDQIGETFAGYKLPDRFEETKKSLEKKSEVKTELKAYKQVVRASELLASRAKSKSAIGRRKLESIIEDYPDTEAANMARRALGKPEEEAFR